MKGETQSPQDNQTKRYQEEKIPQKFNRKLAQLKNLETLMPQDNRFWDLAIKYTNYTLDVMNASAVEFYQLCTYDGETCDQRECVFHQPLKSIKFFIIDFIYV